MNDQGKIKQLNKHRADTVYITDDALQEADAIRDAAITLIACRRAMDMASDRNDVQSLPLLVTQWQVASDRFTKLCVNMHSYR